MKNTIYIKRPFAHSSWVSACLLAGTFWISQTIPTTMQTRSIMVMQSAIKAPILCTACHGMISKEVSSKLVK